MISCKHLNRFLEFRRGPNAPWEGLIDERFIEAERLAYFGQFQAAQDCALSTARKLGEAERAWSFRSVEIIITVHVSREAADEIQLRDLRP